MNSLMSLLLHHYFLKFLMSESIVLTQFKKNFCFLILLYKLQAKHAFLNWKSYPVIFKQLYFLLKSNIEFNCEQTLDSVLLSKGIHGKVSRLILSINDKTNRTNSICTLKLICVFVQVIKFAY